MARRAEQEAHARALQNTLDGTHQGGQQRISASVRLVDARSVGAAELAACAAWLGPAEAARCQRFVRPQRRRQFLIGRALLRQMLGRLLSLSPEQIKLVERPGQAPALDAATLSNPACNVTMSPGFSLSHSGHWVACAVSAGTRLGLDIEVIDAGRDIDALAAQAFDAGAVAILAGLPFDRRVPAFYRMWSEHEARCKLGAGEHGHVVAFAHAHLAFALCSALPLSAAPVIERVTLDAVTR